MRGLRAGELRALRVAAVNLDRDVIHVVAGWDDVEGEIATKSNSGCRVVPIIHASTMIAAGVDPGEVMRWMGHSTVALTLDRYTHALRGSEAETAAKVQSFLQPLAWDSRGTVRHRSERSRAFLSDEASRANPAVAG